MKKITNHLKALGTAALLAATLFGTGAAAAETRRQVIVLFKNQAAVSSAHFATPAAALHARAALRPTARAMARDAANVKDLWIVNGYGMEASEQTIAALAADPNLQVIENFEVKTPDVEALAGGSFGATENWGLSKIGAQASWSAFGVTGRGVRIGHLDTGVDASHPDLAGKVAAWAEFDGNGNRVNSLPHDSAIHGTHTAGTLVGGAASGFPIGVAPGATLVSALVLNGGNGTLMQVLAGMQWVLDPDGNPSSDDGARILSMSLGASGQYQIFQDVTDLLLSAGVLPVFAIGNSGAGRADAPGNCAGALSVGATMLSDAVASFSGGGSAVWAGRSYVKPEISAPGYGIMSSIPNGRYQALSGTSMATPHVAGAAALLLEAAPAMDVQRLRQVLTETAVDLGNPGHDNRFGIGRLDVAAALAKATDRSIVQGVAQGEGEPVPASIRVLNADGRAVNTVRADAGTGRFELSLNEGRYMLQASYGQTRDMERAITVAKGAVVTVNFSFGATSALDNMLSYPNPFRPGRDAHMTFDGVPSDTKITVFTISGEKVAEVSGGTPRWDGRNDAGQEVAAGPYFILASRYDETSGWENKKSMVAVLK